MSYYIVEMTLVVVSRRVERVLEERKPTQGERSRDRSWSYPCYDSLLLESPALCLSFCFLEANLKNILFMQIIIKFGYFSKTMIAYAYLTLLSCGLSFGGRKLTTPKTCVVEVKLCQYIDNNVTCWSPIAPCNKLLVNC